MAHVRKSKLTDPRQLAPFLRYSDIIELSASTKLTPEQVLLVGHELGKPCKTIVGDKGNIIGMYGVTPVPQHPGQGVIWCLTSDELFNIKWQFLRNCKKQIKKITKGYHKVFNFVHAENKVHLKWLDAMDFYIAPLPQKVGVKGQYFYYFEKVIIDV